MSHIQFTHKIKLKQVAGQTAGAGNFGGGIPAIEITEGPTDVGYMCGDDDGDGDFIVDNTAVTARRRSTVTDISSYDHSPPERQQQQVRNCKNQKKNKQIHTSSNINIIFTRLNHPNP